MTERRERANIEHVFWQGSLFGLAAPEYDAAFREVVRTDLDATSWIEHGPGWLRGADAVLDHPAEVLQWLELA